MNLLLFCRALWLRPTTLLTITPTTATLTSFTADKNTPPLATFTPAYPLLNDASLLTAGFQLRTFLQTHLLAHNKAPFSFVLKLSEEITNPHLLATQMGGLLLSIKMPPAQILHRGRCLFFSSPPPCLLFRAAVIAACSALVLSLIASGMWLLGPQNTKSPLAAAPAALPTRSEPATDPTALATILAALALHTPRHQLIELKKNANELSYRTVCTHPQLRDDAVALLRAVTHAKWKLAKTQYRSGYPPLYYCRAYHN